MSALAFALVVAGAFAHAGWNFFAKGAGDAGALFVWLYTGVGVLLYAPLTAAVAAAVRPQLGATEAGFMIGSAVIHTAYLLFLQRGYARGDLSVVYPVARGLGPLLAIAGAVLLLGERPAPLTIAGGLAVCVGVVGLGLAGRGAAPPGGDEGGGRAPIGAMGYAIATGATIACYTLWDAYAISALAISPVLFNWVNNLGRWVLLTPHALKRRREITRVWRRERRAVVAVGLLAPVAYILPLAAFALAPVTHVAPAREVSIVIGTVLGVRVLAEGHWKARMAFATTVLAGVAVLGAT